MFSQIENRYGEHQPNLGVVYRTPVDVALGQIDSYGRGNVHNSIHQWRPKHLNNWNRPMPFPADLRPIIKYFQKNKSCALGYKSDPFQWMDLKYKQTKRVLMLARHYKVKLTISTMSDLCAHSEYLHLLKGHTVIMNMGCGVEERERVESPGAPSILRRQIAVQILLRSGVTVKLIDAHKNVRKAKIDPNFDREVPSKPETTLGGYTRDESSNPSPIPMDSKWPSNVIRVDFKARRVA